MANDLNSSLAVLRTLQQEAQAEQMILIEKALRSDDPAQVIAATQQVTQLQNIEQRQQTAQKSYLYDPMAMVAGMGYKDRPVQMSYALLRRMSRTPIMKAIIETRIEQMAAFTSPQDSKYATGFIIQKKKPLGTDKEPKVSKEDRKKIEFLTRFVEQCGDVSNTWHGDDFDSFMRKSVRDSLTWDQSTFETVRSRKGLPCEFFATDGSTYRLADTGEDDRLNGRNGTYRMSGSPVIQGYRPSVVQLYDSQIVAEFYPWELSFGVRNPTTDISCHGYGVSELEDLVHTVTAMLWSDEYNRRFFSVGSAPKGILKVAPGMSDTQLQSFRQQWLSMMGGVYNSWKTPMLPNDKVEWIDLQRNNRDMEYSKWNEYLIKLACAIYKIDPSEVGFPMQGAGDAKPMFEGSTAAKIKYSKDKGLTPLVKFQQARLNKYVITPLAPEFELRFVGLDSMTEAEELEQDVKKLANFMTINEIRKGRGLDPIDGGDVILSPTYIQALQMQQQQQGAGDPGANGEMDEQDQAMGNNPFAGEEGGQEESPFVKSLNDFLQKSLAS